MGTWRILCRICLVSQSIRVMREWRSERSHTHILFLTYFLSRTLSHTHTFSLTHTYFPPTSKFLHWHTHTLSLFHSLTLTLSLSHFALTTLSIATVQPFACIWAKQHNIWVGPCFPLACHVCTYVCMYVCTMLSSCLSCMYVRSEWVWVSEWVSEWVRVSVWECVRVNERRTNERATPYFWCSLQSY